MPPVSRSARLQVLTADDLEAVAQDEPQLLVDMVNMARQARRAAPHRAMPRGACAAMPRHHSAPFSQAQLAPPADAAGAPASR